MTGGKFVVHRAPVVGQRGCVRRLREEVGWKYSWDFMFDQISDPVNKIDGVTCEMTEDKILKHHNEQRKH